MGFKHHVLFTVTDRFESCGVQEMDAVGQWIFRSDGFMTKVDADDVFIRFGNNACNY